MKQETWAEIRREWREEGLPNILSGAPDRSDLMVSRSLIKNFTVSMGDILRSVSRVSKVSIPQLRGCRRMARYSRARGLCMYLMSIHCHNRSMTEIGKFVGDRDHTTVLHALRVTAERLANDEGDVQRVHDLVCDELDLPR